MQNHILNAFQQSREEKQPCCPAPTSIMDTIDEEATIVIIGGGPHALAALAALHEKSFAFQQYGDDGQFEHKVGFNSLQKIGTGVCRQAIKPPHLHTHIMPANV